MEIINEKEVKEVANFVFPETETTYHMYFNDKADKMIRWLYQSNNIYLYDLKTQKDTPMGTTKLEFIKKFLTWPEDLNGGVNYLQILSPDFS